MVLTRETVTQTWTPRLGPSIPNPPELQQSIIWVQEPPIK